MSQTPEPPAYPPPAAPVGPQEHPQSTLVLVLGILSIFCCGIFTGIPAIIIGRSALREVKASNGAMTEGNLKAGFICAIIGTVWTALVIVAYVAIVVIAIIVGASSSHTTY